MPGWQRRMRHLGIALVLFGCLTTGARADALYSVTSLGPADSSGNYLNALSAADQSAFRAGSFDVFAHPATATNLPQGWISTPGPPDGADIVRTNWLDDATFLTITGMATSNNLNQNAGTVHETFQWTGGLATAVAIFTPSPHTLTDPTNDSLIASPGYLQSLNPGGWDVPSFPLNGGGFIGNINGFNDRGYLITTQTDFDTKQQVAFLQSTNGPDIRALNLGTLGGGNSVAAALNNSNQVVGWSQIASGAQHAFLYMNGTMQDLNLMIPASSGVVLTNALGIDAAGRIVAYGTDASGQTEEYLLTPQIVPAPEPSTTVVFGLAILAVAAARHRSRRNMSS